MHVRHPQLSNNIKRHKLMTEFILIIKMKKIKMNNLESLHK